MISFTTPGMIWDAIRVITLVLLAHSIIVPGRLPWQCAVPHAGMQPPAPAFPPHANLNGEKPKPWAIPVGCSRASGSLPGPWVVTGPRAVTHGLFPGRAQARLRRQGVSVAWACSLQAGQSDLDSQSCCRRQPVLSGHVLECYHVVAVCAEGRRAPVAATVSLGSAPPILCSGPYARGTLSRCARGHRGRTCHNSPQSQVDDGLSKSTVVPIGPAQTVTLKRLLIIHCDRVTVPGGNISAYNLLSREDPVG